MAKTKSGPKKNLRQQRLARQQAEKMKRLRYGGLALLVVLALAALGFYRASTAPAVDAPEEVLAANIDGPADAPVSIVEFGDFGCPSCRGWHNAGIKKQLQAEFGDQISFTFRHFPVITRQSPKAAQAGQCAAEQGQFWAYHDYIYESTPQNALADSDLRLYAAAISLDTAAFDQCLDSGKYESYVARDQQAALAAGARGTPSFFINGQPAGFSYEAMAGAIQAELAGANQ